MTLSPLLSLCAQGFLLFSLRWMRMNECGVCRNKCDVDNGRFFLLFTPEGVLSSMETMTKLRDLRVIEPIITLGHSSLSSTYSASSRVAESVMVLMASKFKTILGYPSPPSVDDDDGDFAVIRFWGIPAPFQWNRTAMLRFGFLLGHPSPSSTVIENGERNKRSIDELTVPGKQ